MTLKRAHLLKGADMFQAKEFINDILVFGFREEEICKKTQLKSYQLRAINENKEAFISRRQQLKLIYMWGNCIHQKNKQHGSI